MNVVKEMNAKKEKRNETKRKESDDGVFRLGAAAISQFR